MPNFFMASARRFISDTIWTDPFIEGCSPEEKLLFIYLFSNPSVNVCGLYQLSLPTAEAQTGIERRHILNYLMKFHEAQKIVYDAGIVFLPNMAKHQRASGILIDKHIQKIATLHVSESNVAYSAFIRHFGSPLEAPSEPLEGYRERDRDN